jgi:spermidine synthase
MNFLSGLKVLEEINSPINGQIKVIRSLGFGTYLQVGGLTQSGGVVYDVWKSTLKQIKNKDIKSVLVLGLGGGSVVTLINKYFPKVKITGVDIDIKMVEMGRKYLGLNKLDLDIVIQDAFKFCLKDKNKYDLIVVDLYRGDTFPKAFESAEFLDIIKKLLEDKGMIIFNRLYYGEKRREATKFGDLLEKHFLVVKRYFPEANIMFLTSATI